MASPQIEDGYLRLSNELAEALARAPLSGSQLRIILTISRECYGRNGGRKRAPLSLAEIAKRTGLDVRGARREVSKLLGAHVLVRNGAAGERCCYGLQKDYERWQVKGMPQGQLSPA